MLKLLFAFLLIWCTIAAFLLSFKFSSLEEKIKAIRILAFTGLCGMLAFIVLFFVIQIF